MAPGFWAQIEVTIEEGILIAPEEVRQELLAPDDLKEWARNHDQMFRELDDELQDAVKAVVGDMYADAQRKDLRLLDRDFKADPFVVALAQTTDSTVITQEIRNRSPDQGRPKIPNICDWYGTRCVDMLTFMREQGFRLR